jgi:hypothetical protein
MKVKDAIELLSSTYDSDDEICIAWWSSASFENSEGEPISKESWSYAVEEFDREEGYDHMNQQMWVLIHGAIMDAEDDGQNALGQ